MTKVEKTYLGDGLYAHDDGFHIWLTTLEGNEVALEAGVLQNFIKYLGGARELVITMRRKSPDEIGEVRG
jgi:hypothetical protein